MGRGKELVMNFFTNVALFTGIRELGDKNDATVTFAAMKAIDYPVVLDINIDQIGTVKGSWKGQIELSGNESQ